MLNVSLDTVSVGGRHTEEDEEAEVKTKATAGEHFIYFCNDKAQI